MSRGKYICSLVEGCCEEEDNKIDPDSSKATRKSDDSVKSVPIEVAIILKNNNDILNQPSTSKDGSITKECVDTLPLLNCINTGVTSENDDYEDVTSGSEYDPRSDETSSDESDNEPLSKKISVLQNKQDLSKNLESWSSGSKCLNHITVESPFHEGTEDYVFKEKREIAKRKIFLLKEKTSKIRPRNPDEWKKRKSTIARQKGEEYVSQTGKTIPKKDINFGMLCKQKCRLNCTDRFNSEARKAIIKKYYNLDMNAKNALLFNSLTIKPVARHRANVKKAKTYSFTYSVTYNKKTEVVCQDALCSLYQFSRKKIEFIQKMLKTGQCAPSPDKRGHHTNQPHKLKDEVVTCIIEHIKKFPAEESHYSRNKNKYKKYLSPILNVTQMHNMYLQECENSNLDSSYKVKLCSYVKIFSTKFNLSFGHPRSDTCSVCDAGKNTKIHTENFKEAFECQKRDRKKATENPNICYITMDLQQTMPLPKLTTSKAFYLRQMWYYNFGIHCITAVESKPHFFNWTEDVANRGSLEIASCLFRFCQFLKESHNNIDHLIVWSDSCSGQNKNFNILSLYQLLILNGTFKVIDHKFPEVGHSYLDSDRNFGRIEKKLRKVENIYVPDQYSDIIRTASTKNCVVANMENYFYAFEDLPAMLHIWNKKTNTKGDKVNFRDEIKWMRVDEFGSYLYKTNLDEYSPFYKVDLIKKGSRVVSKEDSIKPERIRQKIGSLSHEKMENLREQLQFVKDEYKWFYENILENSQENDKKKEKPNKVQNSM